MIEEFNSILKALDRIEELSTKKIKAVLNVTIKNPKYDEKKRLKSAKFVWKVTTIGKEKNGLV